MWQIATGVFFSLILLAPVAKAQFSFTRQEVLAFESAKMPINDFLTGKKGEPVTLAGYLRLPKSDGKNPVVVLFHGAGGVGGEGGPVNDWSRVLNEAGIATFTVDSFSGRGIATLADAGRVSPVSRVVDAYRALELLSKHPLIDANKIVVMGFSHEAARRFIRAWRASKNCTETLICSSPHTSPSMVAAGRHTARTRC